MAHTLTSFNLQTVSIISENQEASLTDAFELIASYNPDLSGLFHSAVNQEALFGFEIDAAEFIMMVSFIGVSTWKVRFGFDADETQGSPFRIILSGYSSANVKMTPSFLLLNEINQPFSSGQNPIIADTLAFSWLQSWENLLIANQVSQSFFNNLEGTLRGYNFQAEDLLDTVASASGAASFSIYLVNHSVPTSDPMDQPSLPGTIGVLIYGENEQTASTFFYDLSAPCPSTCEAS